MVSVRPPLVACEQLDPAVRQAQVGVAGHDVGSASHIGEVVTGPVVIRQYSAWI